MLKGPRIPMRGPLSTYRAIAARLINLIGLFLDGNQQTSAGRRQRSDEPFIRLHCFQHFAHRDGFSITIGGIQHAAGRCGRIKGKYIGEDNRGMRFQQAWSLRESRRIILRIAGHDD